MTLVDFDNGYVIEDATEAADVMSFNQFSQALPYGMVLITFHDRDGDENYLILNPEFQIRATGPDFF